VAKDEMRQRKAQKAQTPTTGRVFSNYIAPGVTIVEALQTKAR
jgi:hypothetical protein